MSLAPFTTPADVRAVCGISTDEVEDEQLDLLIYELALERDLRSVSPGLPEDFRTYLSSPAASPQEVVVVKATQMFATYAVALELTTSLPLMAPKDISDSKTATSRFADAPYKVVIAKVEAAYEKSKAALLDALADVAGGSASTRRLPTLLARSAPSYDPVTGS